MSVQCIINRMIYSGIPKELLDAVLDSGSPVSQFKVKEEQQPDFLEKLEFSEDRNLTCPLGQFWIGVACLCLFSCSIYYTSYTGLRIPNWGYPSFEAALGIIYLIFYFVYCHILYETGLVQIDRIRRRIAKWVTLLLVFLSVNVFVYLINRDIWEAAGFGHRYRWTIRLWPVRDVKTWSLYVYSIKFMCLCFNQSRNRFPY